MIYDVHQHLSNDPGTPAEWKAAMAKAGIGGGAVFSLAPIENKMDGSADFETRLSDVLSFCAQVEDADPVLFIHPDEPDAPARAKEAVARGIAGFKMICNSYYICDDKPMALVEAIAKLGKPIFFHTGILWDGADSSKYNRPAFWEALLKVKRLKFSLAHCSWPWYDECIALYGKFQNSTKADADAPEMFFDLTPGTPKIYRRDLLYKLFHVGYDVPNNILFGTDCLPRRYSSEWAKRWVDIDNEIYDELKIPDSIRELIYEKNYLRFIGRQGKSPERAALNQDSAEGWRLPDAE